MKIIKTIAMLFYRILETIVQSIIIIIMTLLFAVAVILLIPYFIIYFSAYRMKNLTHYFKKPNKKSQGLSMNVIIIAALALVVLVVLSVTMKSKLFPSKEPENAVNPLYQACISGCLNMLYVEHNLTIHNKAILQPLYYNCSVHCKSQYITS